MRHRLLTLVLAGAVIALTVPLWAALSLEPGVPHSNPVDVRLPRPVAEAGTLVMTGGLLIGLASIVRRTS
jgi:hypothetical protein